MTTHPTVPDTRRWWQYAGPWPLYPLADGLVGGLIALSVRSYLITPESAPAEILSAAIFGVVLFATLTAARRYLPGVVATFAGYLGALIVAITVATMIRFVQGYVPDYPDLSTAADVIFAIVRLLVGLIIIQAIIGALQEQLQHQVDATQSALDLVEAQAEALLKADEQVRRSVATLLHDRVQGGLLAACVRLQVLARDVPESQESVERIIHDLEVLRALDVRRAVRTLSPSLMDVDLETAVAELSEAYSSAVTVTISVPRDMTRDPNLRLAAYRIIEQGLLNAVGHGQASTIDITVTPAKHSLDVRMTDDGRGLPPEKTPGFGSMLIDTWCRSLGGSWTLTSGSNGGAVLTAHLPIQ